MERNAHSNEVRADRNAQRRQLAQEKVGGLVNELDVTQQPRRSADADEEVTSGVKRIGSHGRGVGMESSYLD